MLDLKVIICISPKAWHVIDFEHPRLQLMVQHNIESQQVATKIWLLRLTRPVQVLQLRLDHKDGLYYDLFYLVPNHFRVLSVHFAI